VPTTKDKKTTTIVAKSAEPAQEVAPLDLGGPFPVNTVSWVDTRPAFIPWNAKEPSAALPEPPPKVASRAADPSQIYLAYDPPTSQPMQLDNMPVNNPFIDFKDSVSPLANVNKKFNGQVIFISENTGTGTYQVQVYNGGTVTGGTLLTTANFTDINFDLYRSYLRQLLNLLT